jgi:membrane-associated HD superfamily phosphohydrolase
MGQQLELLLTKLNNIGDTALPILQKQAQLEINWDISMITFFIILTLFSILKIISCKNYYTEEDNPKIFLLYCTIFVSVVSLIIFSYNLSCLLINPEYYLLRNLLVK